MEPKVSLPCFHPLAICSMLSQINPVHAVPVLSSVLHLDSRTGPLLLGFRSKTLCAFLLSFLLLCQRLSEGTSLVNCRMVEDYFLLGYDAL
jgi:hypothetical protein